MKRGHSTGSLPHIEQLFTRYGGVLFHKCRRMLGNDQDAEDALQETFVQAFRARNTFTYGDSPLPWLYRIATNSCLKMLRTRRRKGAVPVADIERLLSSTPGHVEQLDARRLLQQLAEELQPRALDIFVAHFIDGMDQGQVATAIGVSRRTVVAHLTRLRARLAELAASGGGRS